MSLLCKAFDQILKEIAAKPTKLETWLKDRRLTNTERKILIGHSWIRNNQNQKVLDEISSITPSEIDFVEAHRSLLIGLAANNLSHFSLADTELKKAIKTFEKLELHYYQFMANFNLFMLAANKVDLKQMRKHLIFMRSIPQELPHQHYQLMRCEFIFSAETDQPKTAMQWMHQIDLLMPSLSEGNRIAHLVSKFMFLVQIDQLDKAQQVLDQMKKFRKFQLSENYNFMKKLLDHLILNKPIYAYAQDFQGVPILFHQLQVIQHLEAHEQDESKLHWQALQKMMPEVFQEDFTYVGTKCLFSLALEKHRPKKREPIQVSTLADTKLEQLISLLETHPAGLHKAHLYELLWGEVPETKEDLKRLARLVYKARQTFQREIQTRKGSYFMEPAKKKIAV